MRTLFELISALPVSSWKYYTRRERSFGFGWHFHAEYELTLITAGCGKRFVGDSVELYRPGDLVLFGPELPHAYASDRDCSGYAEAVVAQFRRDFLAPGLFAGPELAFVGRRLDQAGRGLAFPASTAGSVAPALATLGLHDAAERTIGLLAILVTLARETDARPLASVAFRPPAQPTTHTRIDKACQFLADAYQRRVTLAEAAQVAHMTPSAFSRFFRRAMGCTFTAYLTDLRLGVACQRLVDSDASIASIAADSGFENLSNFNRQFRARKYMTPREYRTAVRQPVCAEDVPPQEN